MARRLALLALLLVVASPAAMRSASAATCAGEKFPAGRTYASCEDLPQLGAAVHWTYDATKLSLSVAFVAAPASSSGGWVAWGLNPTGEGMAGTQALVALKAAGGGAPAVKTYNITGYVPLGGASTPITFPATELAADEVAGGKIRLYGKLQLHKGMKSVNQVWQVGSSITGGAPDKHAFGAANLASKAKLVLTGGKAANSPASEPAPAPMAGGPSPSAGGAGSNSSSSVAPSAGKNAAATVVGAGVSAPALAVMALVGFFLAIV